jgi:hypothetical protein
MGPALSLQRHTLTLDLGNPRLDTVLRLVRLVVLVARKADELAPVDGLGLLELVVVGADSADDLGPLGLEGGGQLVHGVAEVVAVAGRVSEAEDRHGLAGQVEASQVAVDELVPRSAGALRVSTSQCATWARQ